jgi:N-succinyldiaminopimelate aminotransferase
VPLDSARTEGRTTRYGANSVLIRRNPFNVTVAEGGLYYYAVTSSANCSLYNGSDVVLPGSYLAREAQGFNPGAGRIRMALVAETAECVEAAQRIVAFIKNSHS